MKVIVAYMAALIIGFGLIGCQNAPKRPGNVPAMATPIAIPHGYDWDYCWVDKAMNINKCQIYNGVGDLLYGGVFLRYEGTGLVPEESLKITQHGGEAWIELQNGVILIPKSN
jgi:hypothetical protein